MSQDRVRFVEVYRNGDDVPPALDAGTITYGGPRHDALEESRDVEVQYVRKEGVDGRPENAEDVQTLTEIVPENDPRAALIEAEPVVYKGIQKIGGPDGNGLYVASLHDLTVHGDGTPAAVVDVTRRPAPNLFDHQSTILHMDGNEIERAIRRFGFEPRTGDWTTRSLHDHVAAAGTYSRFPPDEVDTATYTQEIDRTSIDRVLDDFEMGRVTDMVEEWTEDIGQ